MRNFEISERDIMVLLRVIEEAKYLIEKSVQETEILWPSLPNGELALSVDSKKYKLYRRSELAIQTLRNELAYLTSEFIDRRGHCANFNGPERRGKV